MRRFTLVQMERGRDSYDADRGECITPSYAPSYRAREWINVLAEYKWDEKRGEVKGMEQDPWKNRSAGMRCRTCMTFCKKAGRDTGKEMGDERGGIGRCRRHAPTMNGFPVVFENDWCGDHKIDETKLDLAT